MRKVIIFALVLLSVFMLASCDDMMEYLAWKQEQKPTPVTPMDTSTVGASLYNTEWETTYLGQILRIKIDERGHISLDFSGEYCSLSILQNYNEAYLAYGITEEDLLSENPPNLDSLKIIEIDVPKKDKNNYVIKTDKYDISCAVEVKLQSDGSLILNSSAELIQNNNKTALSGLVFASIDEFTEICTFICLKDHVFELVSSSTNPELVQRIYTKDSFKSAGSPTDCVIPEGFTDIDINALEDATNLTRVTLPSTMRNIDSIVFNMGRSEYLTSIEVHPNSPYYKSINGVLYSKDGKAIVAYPKGKKDKSYEVLEGVTTIGEGAFIRCENLESIVLPNTLTDIMQSAFQNCVNLSSISIPNGVKTICSSAFAHCNEFTTVNIPSSVELIERQAFRDCKKLTTIDVATDNQYYQSIDGVLYSKDGLTIHSYPKGKEGKTYTVNESVTTIGALAFANADIDTIILPNELSRIESFAFVQSTVSELVIPASVLRIEDRAFNLCENLSTLEYAGTMEQWGLIDKHNNWNKAGTVKTIKCSDGDITL